ncbi:MAG: DNA/RNA non-specific endonuclease [Paraprevotella sp.]|nr:DNA/RNA non-specific endonuclease [Paraprevotella sp.]
MKRKRKKTKGKNILVGLVLAALALAGSYDHIRSYAIQWSENLPLPEELVGRVAGDRPSVRTKTSETSSGITDVALPEFVKVRTSQVIRHTGYTVSYNAETRIPNWVAWTLTPDRFKEVVSRYNKFLPDPEVADPVTTDDYKNSGYDRGHMCPAADNKWDEQAMRESFYLTNICPQDHNLNRGDWTELEDACRDWTMEYGRLYVVAGPVLYKGSHRHIGRSHVTVPEAFYKVVLSLTPPKAIGFIYKNTSGNRPLDAYVNSVDEVERITGIDFFPNLSDCLERVVEAECVPDDWIMSAR